MAIALGNVARREAGRSGQSVANEPATASNLQVPQEPEWHSWGNPNPARSAADNTVSSAAQANVSSLPSIAIAWFRHGPAGAADQTSAGPNTLSSRMAMRISP